MFVPMNDSLSKDNFSLSIQRIATSARTIDTFILIFGVFQLLGQMYGNQHLMHFKPIPIILMILRSIYASKCDLNITKGLLFGLLGDLCLMFPTTLLFEIGAVFFLIGHICYIRAFMKNYQSTELIFGFQKMFPHFTSSLIYTNLIANSFILWNFLPNKGLFLLYGILLSSMAASAFYRVKEKHLGRYWFGVLGAIFFMASDYLIAYSKFKGFEHEMKGFFIMLLYYTGQYMILKGNSFDKGITAY